MSVLLRKRYRISLAASDAPGAKQVEIGLPLLCLLTVAAAVLLGATVCASWIALHSVRSGNQYRAEIESLQEQNQAQAFHIQHFADRLDQLNQQMERLQNFYAKLKILANLDLQEPQDPSVATGGPQPETREINMYLEESLNRQIQRVHWEMEELQMLGEIQERNAYKVEEFFDSQGSLLASTPTIWPVRGWITSGFGQRISPFTGRLHMHEGLDICARTGTPVKATADGVVIYTGWKSDFGKLVTIDHGCGYRTRYGHLSKIYVKNGQRITRGETVGALGNTGRSTGPHLHYEVKVAGLPVNPKTYLLD
jgi:murein DD-endopeptidase MepM/ murein hydrolase activator NlpD